jgi:hypothetical protein
MTAADMVDGWACADCAMLIANGETPPGMDYVEERAWLEDIEARAGQGSWGCGRSHGVDVEGCGRDHGDDVDGLAECETLDFSGRDCSVCGSTLGGYRYGVHWFPWVEGVHR